jgi:soluble lytic murein transglycosylase-like protein
MTSHESIIRHLLDDFLIRSEHHSVNRLDAFLTLMIVLNVDMSAAQAGVSDNSVDRKVEQISANGALKSYVEEASQRFLIPSSWTWAVMRVESAGDARALSNKAAIRLMQIMPDTCTMLR